MSRDEAQTERHQERHRDREIEQQHIEEQVQSDRKSYLSLCLFSARIGIADSEAVGFGGG